VAQGHVRPAARPDPRQLGLVVQLLRPQLVGPHAGSVYDVGRADVEPRAALAVVHLHALRPAVALEQAGHVQPVGAHRAEALGLAEHGQDEPDVVGLAVVEQVAAGRLAIAQRRQQVEHLLPGDHAMALRAPRFLAGDFGRGCRLRAELGGRLRPAALGAERSRALAAARAAAPTLDRHHVVQVQTDADEPVGAGAFERRDDERERPHEVRRELDHQLALEQRLADQPEVEVLQVAKAAVDELARAAGGPRGVVVALQQRDAVAARGGVERNAGAGDPAADDHHVELLLAERAKRLAALDHARSLAEPERQAGALRARRARL
jgi:hypothetical protein